MTEDDNQLIMRIAEGDQDAMSELYDRYASLLIGMGLGFIRSRESVEDVAHDVFVEIWRTAQDFDPTRGQARTWIIMKMRCRLLDRLRRSKRRQALLHQHGQLLEPRSPTSPLNKTMQHQVQNAIDTLPDHLKEIIQHVYYEGLSSSETADSLDIPTGTVKSRMAKARAMLHDLLHSGEPS